MKVMPPDNHHHYFAYGSNLCLTQLRGRCASSVPMGKAHLPDYRLGFPIWSDARDGMGVAGIIPAQGQAVEGFVYAMSWDDILQLDIYECVADGQYTREEVTVEMTEGHKKTVWTYIPCDDPAGPYAPSDRYLDIILRGAREHSLSPDYITFIESFRKQL